MDIRIPRTRRRPYPRRARARGRASEPADLPAHGAEADVLGVARPFDRAPPGADRASEEGATIEAPSQRRRYPLRLRGGEVVLGDRTWVMGVLNVTPDSFSDGGRFLEHAAAVHHGLALFEAGADVVDVGGESTRPGGAAAVSDAEECRRVVPVIRALRDRGAGPLSVDTTKASVARAALDAGADIVNDVSGFRFDPAMAPLVAERRVPAVV